MYTIRLLCYVQLCYDQQMLLSKCLGSVCCKSEQEDSRSRADSAKPTEEILVTGTKNV